MQPEVADLAYLWDMLDAAAAVKEYVSDKTIKYYLENRMLRDAVERNVEIIGEAANQVSPNFQKEHSEIPWRKVISQRHVLTHEYGEIKHELMWKVATVNVPELIAQLENLVPASPEES